MCREILHFQFGLSLPTIMDYMVCEGRGGGVKLVDIISILLRFAYKNVNVDLDDIEIIINTNKPNLIKSLSQTSVI